MTRIWTMVFLVLLGTACQQSHPAPTTPSPTTPSPTTPSPVSSTFTITGFVRDTVMRPLRDAKVEVVTGPMAGQFTTTDEEGHFAFAPFTAETATVTLQVTRDGYLPARPVVRPVPNPFPVVLMPLTLVNLEGEYQLTFTADNICSDLPRALRTRTYTATISRGISAPQNITIALGGAEFAPGYRTFLGAVASDAARFDVFSLDAINRWLDSLPIFERPDPATYLSFMGVANAAAVKADVSIDAAFDGSIAYCAAAIDPSSADFPPSCSVPLVVCKSNTHQLSLTRR